MEGFIALHRRLLDNPIFYNADLLQLFLYCCLKANYKDNEFIFNDEMIKVKRGDLITGRKELSKALKQKEPTVYKRLKLLEKLGYIGIKSTNKFSIISILKYDFYQNSNNKDTAQTPINKGDNEPATPKSNNHVTTTYQPRITNNNVYKKNNNIYSLFENLIPTELNAIPEFTESWSDFVKHRKEIKKPLTETAAKRILKKLLNYHNESNDVIKIIDNSITRGWQDVFPYTGQIQPPANKQTIEPLKFNFR